MEISYALLCDAANISDDGNLNVLGSFSVLYAQEFPYVHPLMSVALQFEVAPEDAGHEHEFMLQLVDPDGGLIHESALFVESVGPTTEARAYRVPSFEKIENTWHPTPGDYEMRILYQGGIMAMVPYEILRL